MSRLTELFRDRPWKWLVPLTLLIVNLMVVSTYRAIYAGRVSALENQIEERRSELVEVRGLVAQVQAKVDSVHAAKSDIEEVYTKTFATEEERLTQLIREVRQLAVQAGLEPDNISYPQEQIEDYDLFERSIRFSVEGSYESLRTFVNFLELSESFIVLRSLDLTGDEGRKLRITLALSTLFSGRDLPAREATG